MPIRRSAFNEAEANALPDYLESIRPAASEVIVIDGSPPEVFDWHHEWWSALCRHEPVNRQFGFINDKVNGIQTGVRLAVNEKIILADDDIRYTACDIDQIATRLD